MGAITKLHDFRQIPIPEKLLEISVKEADIRAFLEQKATSLLTIEPATGPIQTGDIVTLQIAGEEDPDHVRIGSGHSPDWDECLHNKSLGETCISPESGAETIIQRVMRRAVPELNDGNVGALRIDGVQTLEQLEQYAYHVTLEKETWKKMYGIEKLITGQIAANSTFEGVEDDVNAQYQFYWDYLAQEGGNPEKKLKNMYHCNTLQAAQEKLRDGIVQQLRPIYVAEAVTRSEGRYASDADYEEYVVKTAAEQGKTAEQIREQLPRNIWATQQALDTYKQILREYVQPKFRIFSERKA